MPWAKTIIWPELIGPLVALTQRNQAPLERGSKLTLTDLNRRWLVVKSVKDHLAIGERETKMQRDMGSLLDSLERPIGIGISRHGG
jgi:hypothetical protein